MEHSLPWLGSPKEALKTSCNKDAQPELAVAIQLQLLPPSNSAPCLPSEATSCNCQLPAAEVWPLGEREQLQLKAFWFVDAIPSLLLFQGASLLQAELQRKTGFSRQLHMTSLRYLMQSMHITGTACDLARQSSSCAIVDFAIIGLRKERAALLKAGNRTAHTLRTPT